MNNCRINILNNEIQDLDNTRASVSILIPTFQRPEKLRRAIESAQAQTYTNIIIYVIDNASGDETCEVALKIGSADSRVKYHCHAENIGMIANYNYSLSNVNTKYFAFLADDDVLLPECIMHAVKGLEQNPEVVFWGGNTIHIDEQSGRVLNGTNRSWKKGGVYSSVEACKRICNGDHLDFQGLLFRTEMVRMHQRSFHKDVVLLDVDIEMQLAKHHPIGVTPAITAIMYSHVGSISSGVKSINTYWPSLELIERNFSDDNPLQALDVIDCKRRWRSFMLVTIWYIGARSTIIGNNEEAVRAATILKDAFPNGIVPRVAHGCIITGLKSKIFSTAMWFVFCGSSCANTAIDITSQNSNLL